jgi:Kef-type K+ transport system membrane component KefB
MSDLLVRALGLLALAILVAIAARRLRLPYTVGLVLAGFRIDAGTAHIISARAGVPKSRR